jgi:hypothetical protein
MLLWILSLLDVKRMVCHLLTAYKSWQKKVHKYSQCKTKTCCTKNSSSNENVIHVVYCCPSLFNGILHVTSLGMSMDNT